MKPLTQRQIFGYTVGDLGINLNFQFIGFYLPTSTPACSGSPPRTWRGCSWPPASGTRSTTRFYRINGQFFQRITRELEERKTGATTQV